MSSNIRLYTLEHLDAIGWSHHAVHRACAAGRLTKLRPGVFTPPADWARATPEHRMIARARALQLISRAQPVFSHETAAAIHGFGLYRPGTERVHAIVAPDRPGRALGVIRHRGAPPDEHVTEVGGLLVTSVERTVADISRTADFDRAVTVADAALRRTAHAGSAYDLDAAAALRERIVSIARDSAQGVSRAERVVRFADGRAQLPGESVSRVRLFTIGFRHVRLQVPVVAPDGSMYFVDFGLEDVLALGEFDGAIKYVDGRYTDGRTTAEIFDREKQREDWIRGRTQRPLARWGFPHLDSPQVLGDRLAAFGIHPPR